MLGSKDASVLRYQSYSLTRKNNKFQIVPSTELDTFSKMRENRINTSPESLENRLKSNEPLYLANIGVTVLLSLLFQNREFAVFTRRADGEFGHICGYTPAGHTFSETAKIELLEEFIVKENAKYLLSTGEQKPPYDGVEFVKGTPWDYTFQTELTDFKWVPSITPTSMVYGEHNVNLHEELPFLIYIDPYTSSAQAVFGCKISLPERNSFSLLHAEDRHEGTRLISEIKSPLILAEIHNGRLSGDAYEMKRGILERINLIHSTFHVGMSKASPNAVYQAKHTEWEDLIG